MRKLKRRLTAMLVSLVIVTFVLLSQRGPESTAVNKASPSAIDSIEVEQAADSLRQEVFKFHKSITVRFGFSDEEIDQGFDGLLFMDWSKEKTATVALSMKGHRPDIFIKAHFTDDFHLRCIETPKALTEEESDYVLLLKNLVLDYSFKTNRDDNGEYLASLTVKNLSTGFSQATKIKSRYLDPEKSGLKVKKSLHKIKLGRSILEARGEEHFELFLNGNSKTASTKSTYQLLAIQGQEGPKLNLKRELIECNNEFSQQMDIVKKMSPKDFQELTSRIATHNRGARQDVIRQILKALRSNPELLSDFMAWVHSIQDDRKLSALAIGILGNLGTVSAQRELVNLFTSTTDKNSHLHHQVLNAFTLTSSALSGESREFLKSQLTGRTSHLAEGAAYALGTSIENDPSSMESKADLKYLINKLDQEHSLAKIGIYLDALSNSASPEVIGTFKKYAASDNKFIREKALLGLQLIETRASK